METQNTTTDLDQQVNALSKMFNDQLVGSFEKVISTDEGKEILRKTYRDELIGLWEDLPNLDNKKIDKKDLESFIQKLDGFLFELKKSIQFPHRRKVNSQFSIWQKKWGGENILWMVFLENCTDEDLDVLDGISQEIEQLEIPQGVVRNLIDRWLKSEFIALAQKEKSGQLLIQWASEVRENSKKANDFQKWLDEITQSSNNLPSRLGCFFTNKWVMEKSKSLEKTENFSYHWKIYSLHQDWSQEWKNLQEKIQTLTPILPLLNPQEVALFEKYYHYLPINLDVVENIKKDVQTIVHLREYLNVTELSKEWPKLVQPIYSDVDNLIKSAPKNQVTISSDKDDPAMYIIHLRHLNEQVPTWQEEFKRASQKITEIANSWYVQAQNRKIPNQLSETTKKMMAACTHIETMADLVTAHNYLIFVQEDMKEILTAEMGEFTTRIFREINSLLDRSDSVSVNEILSLYAEPEVEQALFNLVRQNLIKLEIRR